MRKGAIVGLVAAHAALLLAMMPSGGAAQTAGTDTAGTGTAENGTVTDPCAQTPPRRRGGFGGFLGKWAGETVASGARKLGLGMSGGTRNTLNQALSDYIACRLQPREREQAAAATMAVVDRPVGTTATWSSETRPGVSGSSTVNTETTTADGMICKDVRDVATVNGEETVMVKRMCKAPGASGFTLQTADV